MASSQGRIRALSIASRIFLAAALATGLMHPGGAHAALQGFSIELGDPQDPLTLNYNPAGGLSAEVAAANGQPAKELQNNGSYLATVTGDYAVIDDLPPMNKSVFWLESYEIMLNGREIFGNPTHIVGPFSGEDIWQAFLHVFNQVTGLPPADLNVIIAVLEHRDSFQTNGVFDYVYNTLNQPVGTFAVGTTSDLGQRIALNVGTNTLSFDFSLFAVPELSTWAMMLLGFAGLGFIGYRRTRRAKPLAT
jgi:hypothetical protein